jgi:hypothetical protein
VHFTLNSPATVPSHLIADLLPFGMPLRWATNAEGGLRKRTNLLGRYDMINVSCFQGVPPHAVFAAYIQALRLRGMDLEEDGPRVRDSPSVQARLALSTLRFLYQAVQEKCYRFSIARAGDGSKDICSPLDRYAAVYRAGQVDICQSVRQELQEVFTDLRARAATTLDSRSPEPCTVNLFDVERYMEKFCPHLYVPWTQFSKPVSAEGSVGTSSQRGWVCLLAFWRLLSLLSRKT